MRRLDSVLGLALAVLIALAVGGAWILRSVAPDLAVSLASGWDDSQPDPWGHRLRQVQVDVTGIDYVCCGPNGVYESTVRGRFVELGGAGAQVVLGGDDLAVVGSSQTAHLVWAYQAWLFLSLAAALVLARLVAWRLAATRSTGARPT